MLDFGLNSSEFRSRYMEQQPYLRKAALKQPLLRWTELDGWLYSIEANESSVQMFNHGQVAPQAYLDDVIETGRRRQCINKHRFYALMQSGATLVLNRIEAHAPLAKRLCAEVGRFASCTTTGNAYASFGGAGTFGQHWDTHDVFAIQLIGKKRWRVYQPTFPLPLSHHTTKQLQHQCPSTPVLDAVLNTGDMLYIPRGWWHEVTPFDEGSLHLSVGGYLPTLCDYLMWVCSRQAPRHLNARRGVINAADCVKDMTELMRELSQAACSPDSLREFVKDMHSHERLNTEFDVGLFLDKRSTGLQDDAQLALTSSFAPDVDGELHFNGGRMKLDPIGRTIVRELASVSSLQLRDLYHRLAHVPQHVVRTAVTELARCEAVRVIRKS